jgi:putative transposase
MAALKSELPWLQEAPSHCLQQALLDLDRGCRRHGTRRIHWRAKHRWSPSFRFPYPIQIRVRRISRRWGEVVLPKFGACRFRWSRDLGGAIRHVTVKHDGRSWNLSFCIEDGLAEALPNGLSSVGIDRGVVAAISTSEGITYNRSFRSRVEARRLARLQRRFARRRRGSARRKRTADAICRMRGRERRRRQDFVQQTAHTLASTHGLVVLEDLRVRAMTASAKGTTKAPGRNVAQKAGLNGAILDKGWGQFRLALISQGREHGCQVVVVPPAFTSQTCSNCRHVASESRESQACFRCVACRFECHADTNAARVILAAGLAVPGRGGLARGQPVKRQPTDIRRLSAGRTRGVP